MINKKSRRSQNGNRNPNILSLLKKIISNEKIIEFLVYFMLKIIDCLNECWIE